MKENCGGGNVEMTLDEAIAHLDETLAKKKDWSCEKCRNDHVQLRKWLAELKSLEGENKQLKAQVETYKNTVCFSDCADVMKENTKLQEENERLKKNAIVWHKIELDKIMEPPLKDGGRYLVLFKDGDICSADFWRGGSGCFFGAYASKEIEAWAEMPEAKL